jgi:cation diffusion facilitator CzcD-associated flavoprotein CzcO
MVTASGTGGVPTELDVAVVGAGFSGLYLLLRLRRAGFSVKVFESADDIGGTWYWNRYPGARCDVPTTDYCFSFDEELEEEWTWSEKYATQPEILAYVDHVARRYDLRRDIVFSTPIEAALWDEAAKRWTLTTGGGGAVRCRYYVMATGCLSAPKTLDIAGTERFEGTAYYTSRWPHEPVDFSGQRVAVIGTGSSGIQSIPLIAAQASELTVFQRTPNYSVPALNGPRPPQRVAALAEDRDAYRESAKWSRSGIPTAPSDLSVLTATETVRRQRFEQSWATGELFAVIGAFSDTRTNLEANDVLAEMIREKVRDIVGDPETAEALCPQDYPFGTKRPCLDTDYFTTFNLAHTRLVDLRKESIKTVTETGIDTVARSYEFDSIVYATGFDAMTGALAAVDITGRDGITLKEKWAEGPMTYLGLTTAGFPNLFTVTGPQSPSVLSNMMVSIEQHVDWITDCLEYMRAEGFDSIEPTSTAEVGWNQHNNDCGDLTLMHLANSWYVGANVPGKPRVLLPYTGGVAGYRKICDEVVDRGYLGFDLEGPGRSQRNDGVIREIQPDVEVVLAARAAMDLPPMESMSVADARAFVEEFAKQRPAGPAVGEIVDGTWPGRAEDLRHRLYRPATPGPHPIIVYFHGDGWAWVLGSEVSDDPLCRDLCVRSDAVVVSVNYRHAPEARFPAAADDAFAAVLWVAANAIELGGFPANSQ